MSSQKLDMSDVKMTLKKVNHPFYKGRTLKTDSPRFRYLRRVMNMPESVFGRHDPSYGYRQSQLSELRRKYILSSTNNFKLKPKLDLRGKISFATTVTYRIDYEVMFDHGSKGIEPVPISLNIKIFRPLSDDHMLKEFSRGIMAHMNTKPTSYMKSYVSHQMLNWEVLYEDDDIRYDFTSLENRGIKNIFAIFGNKETSGNTKVHNQCVIDYLLKISKTKEQGQKKKRSHLTLRLLETQFSGLGINIDTDAITNKTLIEWYNKHHSQCCSIVLVDGLMNIRFKSGKNGNNNGLTYVIVSTNGHCYGVHQHKLKFCKSHESVKVQLIKKTRHEYINLRKLSVDSMRELVEGNYCSDRDILIDASMYYDSDNKKCSQTLDELFSKILRFTQSAPYGMRLDDTNNLLEFYHPLNAQRIALVTNYEKNKRICEQLYEKFPYHQFKYREQTLSQISVDLFSVLCGKWKTTSHYTKETQRLMKDYCTSPLVQGINDGDRTAKNYSTYDYKHCYVNAILAMDDDLQLPVFEECDLLEDYSPCNQSFRTGFYLIKKAEWMGGIVEDKQLVPHYYAEFLLAKGFITHQDIEYQIHSSHSISAKVLKDFVYQLTEMFDERTVRDIVIMWIGKLGQNEIITNQACVTSVLTEVDYFVSVYEKPNTKVAEGIWVSGNDTVKTRRIDGDFIVTHTNRTLKLVDHAPIMRCVHSTAKILMCTMLEAAFEPGVSILGTIRTDGFDGWNLRYHKSINWHLGKDITPIKANEPKPKRLPFPAIQYNARWNKLDDFHFDGSDQMRVNGVLCPKSEGELQLEQCTSKSMLIHGDGGCQKTVILVWLILKAIERGQKIVVLTLSNRARACILKKLGNVSKEVKEMVQVLASFFHEEVPFRQCPDIIFVDECSQISMYFYRKLRRMKERGAKLILSGDFLQTGMVNVEDTEAKDSSTQRYYDMFNRTYFKDLVDNNLMQKSYYPTCARNDKLLYSIIKESQKRNRLLIRFPESDIDHEVHLVFTRKKKKEINDYWMKKLGMKHKFDYKPGMRVAGITNCKKDGILNGVRYIVLQNNGLAGVVVKDGEGKILNATCTNFEVGYADTIHRWQGDKISCPFSIWEVNHPRFNMNLLNTALGRSEQLNYIHMDSMKNHFSWEKEICTTTPVELQQYEKGIVYRLWWDEDKVEYIGETMFALEKRNEDRNRDEERVVKKYGKTYNSGVICDAFFFRKADLRYVETYYIHDSVFYSNLENVNAKQKKATRTKELDIDIEEGLVIPINQQVVDVILKKDDKDGRLVATLGNLNKMFVKTKFSRIRERFTKKGVLVAEELLLEKVMKYFNSNNISKYNIVRHYKL